MHKFLTPADGETHLFKLTIFTHEGKAGGDVQVHRCIDDDDYNCQSKWQQGKVIISHSFSVFSIQNDIMRRVCTTHHIRTHTSHTDTSHIYILRHSNIQPASYKTSLAALYLKDTTDWKCVRMRETQSPELSLFSMSVAESGCLFIPLTHTHAHTPYSQITFLPLCQSNCKVRNHEKMYCIVL